MWIVGKKRFSRVNFSCGATCLQHSAQKSANKWTVFFQFFPFPGVYLQVPGIFQCFFWFLVWFCWTGIKSTLRGPRGLKNEPSLSMVNLKKNIQWWWSSDSVTITMLQPLNLDGSFAGPSGTHQTAKSSFMCRYSCRKRFFSLKASEIFNNKKLLFFAKKSTFFYKKKLLFFAKKSTFFWQKKVLLVIWGRELLMMVEE